MFLVIKWNGKKEVGLLDNGKQVDIELAELMSLPQATECAEKYGGKICHYDDIFG